MIYYSPHIFVEGRETMLETSSGCGGCGSCGGCRGCGGVLELTAEELDLLGRFAQLPFLPVARRPDSEAPVCLEEGRQGAEWAPAITGLERRGLIDIDYHLPLSNFDYGAYKDYALQGSMALTARGQRIVEQLEIQGIEEE